MITAPLDDIIPFMEQAKVSGFKKLFGDKKFYAMVIAIAIPIMIQQGITNFVSLLDNIMVGRIGTEQMSGVSIANQILYVFNVSLFGAVSGASIFGAQFFGQGNTKGVRDAFRFKLLLCLSLAGATFLVVFFFKENLINYFLHESEGGGDLALTLAAGIKYIDIMLFGLLPTAMVQAYSSTLRETGHASVPMRAGVVAVILSFVLNLILINGLFGLPAMGVAGAGLSTVISKFLEAFLMMSWTHRHKDINPFIVDAWKTLIIPPALMKNIVVKGCPLLLNEFLWSLGMTTLSQLYSLRGLDTVAAVNITSTLANLFNVANNALGSSIAIILGNVLGANELEKAKDYSGKLITFAVMTSFVFGTLLASVSGVFPLLYKTTSEVRSLATKLIIVYAASLPLQDFAHAAYYVLRSGGKTFITMLFDSCYVWTVRVSLVYVLAHFTAVGPVGLYAAAMFIEAVKCTVGFILVRKGVWVHNITAYQ